MNNKINPMSCNIGTFLQYYKNYPVIENKVKNFEICIYNKKNIYSYAQVKQIIKGMKKSHTRTHNKVYLRVYKCEKCNGWHLTSSKTIKNYRKEKKIA